jgi:hypothetical protein
MPCFSPLYDASSPNNVEVQCALLLMLDVDFDSREQETSHGSAHGSAYGSVPYLPSAHSLSFLPCTQHIKEEEKTKFTS